MRSWPRMALLAAALSGVALVGWCARTPAIPVDASEAREAELIVEVSTNGKVEPIDKAEVRARLDGRIVEIRDPGVRVAAGERLLRIDPGPVEAELAAARSERLSARQSLRSARNSLERIRRRAETDAELFAQGGITRQRHGESQAELKEARARVASLEGEVPLRVASLDLRIQELEARLDAAEVRAPFAGTIYRTGSKRGETVRVGDPILWFADLDRLRVRANVDQVDFGRVKIGQPVRVTSNAYPGRVWSAQISEVIPHVVMKQSRLVAEALANVDPPSAGLVPGMTVDVEIVVEEVASALQVPAEAIFTDERGSFVYRIEGGRAKSTRVVVGRSTVGTVEIVEGLVANDRVVIGAVRGLEDGARVAARIQNDGHL